MRLALYVYVALSVLLLGQRDDALDQPDDRGDYSPAEQDVDHAQTGLPGDELMYAQASQEDGQQRVGQLVDGLGARVRLRGGIGGSLIGLIGRAGPLRGRGLLMQR